MVKTIFFSLVSFLCLFQAVAPASQLPRPFPYPNRIYYDSQCLTIDGKDIFIYSGAFHFFRCPKELWPDRFQKIKDAGFNTVETYVPWNWCEPQMPRGTNDFSRADLKDFDDWLTMAEQYGFYIIVRPGPYICAEWDNGGYPQWLLTKKPANPLRSQEWLRTDDPVYLSWCKHWYDAVCPVIARHQITRKAPGQLGVILVQVENEYDFPQLPDEVKINQVKALAEYAQADGIDVPLITCWTHVVRGSKDPVLRQIFDCCNFYPRWAVDDTRKDIRKLRREQPDAPLATTELQGGWFANVGGKLSEDQDGVTASEINNLTLFVIQNGESILNYYMLFGGTNPDDRAARPVTTTYDYAAPIREWGGVGDRYQRVWAIGHMLQKHGAQLARSTVVDCNVTNSQNDVTVVERRTPDGGRYFFIRTSQHLEPRKGTSTVQENISGGQQIVFNYDLEPFGSKILYLPPGVNDISAGEWLPKEAPPIERPANLPQSITINLAKMQADPGPRHLIKLKEGESLAPDGIYDSHFIFYQAKVSCPTATNLLVEYPDGDAVLALVNGQATSHVPGAKPGLFELPAGKNLVSLLYENHGHDNFGTNMEPPCGITAARLSGNAPANVPLSFGRPTGDDNQWWKPNLNDTHWTSITPGETGSSPTNAVLTWYRMNFSLPSPQAGVWVPWRLHIAASGNGFLYLNGHPLGRYWDVGPQHDYFLPECWLHFGDGQPNNITLNLRPTKDGAALASAIVEPYSDFAEKR
ncbi:MAG TPA: beta-galactosidase [Pseudomonadales bacterium]|nr:beta-galactosidase [Pseudomonadales bacterium]